jgi:hypothetical protein
MIIFKNKSGIKRLSIVCDLANDVVADASFWRKWEGIRYFNLDYTSEEVTPLYIYNQFMNFRRTYSVEAFKSKWPWSSSNGYTTPGIIDRMWLNTRRLDRSDASIVATLFHEPVHSMDSMDVRYFFGHGEGRNANVPKMTHDENYNGGCVPEVIADMVYEHLTGRKSEVDSSIH